MSVYVSLLRATYQIAGLFFILLAIPLAFDVGGESCGLSFTFLLSVFYFVLCTNRWLFRRTKLYPFTSILYYFQFIIIPSLLLVHLSQCQNDSWVQRAMIPWTTTLKYATGLFSLLEGFCTLMVIQSFGRACSKRMQKSDPMFFSIIVLASVVLTLDFYLLMRIYLLPDIVGVTTATLIGSALTISVGIGVFGIWSCKGNVVESTLLFSYVVYEIYLTLTDFQTSSSPSPLEKVEPSLWDSLFASSSNVEPDFSWPPHLLKDAQLPTVIIESYTEFMTTVAELTPTGIKTLIDFFQAAMFAITPSVCVSLIIRVTSYFFALRLVPYINHQTPRSTPLPEKRKGDNLVMIVYSYSPILIIAVYTHLLLQHFGHIVHVAPDAPSVLPFDITKIWSNSRQAWQFWGWANVFCVLGVYGIELAIGPSDIQSLPHEEEEEEEVLDIS